MRQNVTEVAGERSVRPVGSLMVINRDVLSLAAITFLENSFFWPRRALS
jgi:hypothetical protein